MNGTFQERAEKAHAEKGAPSVSVEGIIGLVSTIRDKANRFILKELKSRRIEDVDPAYGAIFVNLFVHKELTMGDIARSIERNKSTVTVLVNKMVKRGYLETEKDSRDSRFTRVRLTQKGKGLERDFMEISENLFVRIYEGFSDMEKEILIRLLARVNHNL